MSVHGEYARALAGVMEKLADCGASWRDAFRHALDAARVTADRDLSSAARSAREALDRMLRALDAPSGSAAGDPLRGDALARDLPCAGGESPEPERQLRDACEHLRAHVDAILGTRPTTR